MEETTNTAAAAAEAETVHEPAPSFPDRLRRHWDSLTYQSTPGSWGLRLILTLVVLLSLSTAVNFGLAANGSLLNDFFSFLSRYFADAAVLLFAAEILLAVIWLFSPTLGSLLCAAALYACYGTVSPNGLMAAMLIFLMFLPEERTVLALMLALPSLCFSTSLNCGIFLVVWAAFASTRKNNGTVKTMSFVYFALLELCRGTFGTVTNKSGVQIIPAVSNGLHVTESLKNSYAQWAAGKGLDDALLKLLIPLIIFFIIGLIFAKLLNLRFSRKKLSVDLLDGICFAVLLLLLCSLPYAIPGFTELAEFSCGVPSIIMQVVAAYLITRPIAGASPIRGNLPARTFKHYIFISYAHLDLSRVKPFLNILKDRGYNYWYDDSIATGSAWQDVIAGNLAGCTCCMAFISETSIRSDYCLKELNYAISKKKPIALILLDDTKLPPTIEMHLASMQSVQRYKMNSDEECMEKVFQLDKIDLCCSE